MRFLSAVSLALPLFAACGGDDAGDVAAVFPDEGFTGRSLTVEISGDTTSWDSATTVSFGDGVTVNAITLISPSSLQADLTIAPNAALGARDVTVTDNGDTVTLAGGFTLDSPVDIEFQGSLAQGSIATFTIINKDLLNPFDDTSTGDGFFEPLVFTNFAVTAPAGVELLVDSVDSVSASGIALFDLDAAPGAVTISSGPADGEVVVSNLAADLDVQARTATDLTAGQVESATVGGGFESHLYRFVPGTSPSINEFLASSDNADASPAVAILPASGKFADLIDFSGAATQLVESGSAEFFLVYWDNTGSAGYSYSLVADSTSLTSVADAVTNNAPAQAQDATFTTLVTGGVLVDDTDEHWYKIPVAAGDIGKSVRVLTSGDPETDTVVEVFSNAAGNATLGGESENLDFHENHTSEPIPANTTVVTVRVSADQTGFFDPAHGAFSVAIFLQ